MNYEILVGDVLDGLAQLADNSVQVAEMSRKRIERETGGLFDFDANPSGSEPEAVTGVDGNSNNGGAV